MASIADQIVGRIAVVAQSALGAVPVYRSREQPTEDPAHVRVMRGAETFDRFGAQREAMKAVLDVDVVVYATGTPWDAAADAMVVPLHAAVLADETLKALAGEVRMVSIEPTAAGSPVDAGELVLHYVFQYPTRASALDLKPFNLT